MGPIIRVKPCGERETLLGLFGTAGEIGDVECLGGWVSFVHITYERWVHSISLHVFVL